MIQTDSKLECIYSRLGGDPELGDIVEMFVEEMPERAASLRDYLNVGDFANLRQAAHRLKGAAGSYGFDQITPCAGRLEAAISESEPESQIRQAVAELVDLCERVRGGQPALGN